MASAEGTFPPPSPEERKKAMWAWLGGVPGALSIWTTWRRRSRFVAFQALQALYFHLGLIGLGFLGVVVVLSGLVIAFTAPLTPFALAFVLKPFFPQAEWVDTLIVFSGMAGILFAVLALMAVVSIFISLIIDVFILVLKGVIPAATRVSQGEDVRLPIVASLAERHLSSHT